MKKCKSCRTEIDPKAKKCPHCQTDQRSWFGRHPILTGLFVLIIAGSVLGAIGGNKTQTTTPTATTASSSQEQTQQPTPTSVAPIIVDATALVGEYDKNKLAAQDKYTGKIIQTTAFIKNISSDIAGSYYLSLEPTKNEYYFGTSLQCYFADKSPLTSLANGQSVTVTGKMEDMSLGTIELKECNLVK